MMNKRVLATALTVMGHLVATGGACAQGTGAPVAVSDVWPRAFTLPNATLLVYQPQAGSWDGNVLNYRAAVGVKATGSGRTHE